MTGVDLSRVLDDIQAYFDYFSNDNDQGRFGFLPQAGIEGALFSQREPEALRDRLRKARGLSQ